MRAITKRVFLFLVVNFLVILVVSFVLQMLHVQPYLRGYGLDVNQLLIFCFIWGMVGAGISLALSKIMAKWLLGVEVLDPNRVTGSEAQLVTLVHKLARRAGLSTMPEVGIYESQEVNAFATGPTRSRALVAVSSGLLQRMNMYEIEGVLGHEVSHIMNGDMVTMTLLQGVVNAFVMFFARVIAYAIMQLNKRDNESGFGSSVMYMLLVFVFEIVFMLLGSIVIATYSRFREFRADSGGARLAGKDKMIAALHALQKVVSIRDQKTNQPAIQALKISSSGSFLHLFASHPPLEDRIHRLEVEG